MPLVSILLPVKNAASTLGEAIGSCVSQTWRDWELVVVDNESTDDSRAVADAWAARDGRIRVLWSGGSIVDAPMEAWKVSKGELIARMDADDVCMPLRLEKQVEALGSRPELAGCGTSVEVRRRGPDGWSPCDAGFQRYAQWINALTTPERVGMERFVESPVVNPTLMVRRDVFAALGGYREPPGNWAEDYDLILRILESGRLLTNLPDKLLIWVDSARRVTRTMTRYSQDRFLAAKAHFLHRLEAVKREGIWICGAGPIGKSFAALAKGEGTAIHGFFDVHPRRIGETIAGLPVLDGNAMIRSRHGGVLLGAVGQIGGRQRVRDAAEKADYIEGEDFWLVA